MSDKYPVVTSLLKVDKKNSKRRWRGEEIGENDSG